MKRININFADCGPNNACMDPLIEILKKDYQVVISDKPDYLFFSSYGFEHYNPQYKNCIKIFYTTENTEPDFSSFDYGLAFQHLTAGDRYLRFPLYVVEGYEHLQNHKILDKEKYVNRKFCNYVSSKINPKIDPFRTKFLEALNKYKKVDCAGQGWEIDLGSLSDRHKKFDFIKDYKFTFALENSSLSGYTTEKIVQPMIVNSMPVYWGNPDVGLDFNKKSFICINDFKTVEEAIEEIIRLDNDDEAYIEKLSQPWFLGDDYGIWETRLRSFFYQIFDQPVQDARRTTFYGYIQVHQNRMSVVQWSWPVLRKFMKIREYLKKHIYGKIKEIPA